MKKVNLKYIRLGVVFVLLVVGIPVIMDKYIIGNNVPSNIDNSDWVSFLGSYIGAILGALGSLLAIYITYNQNNKLHIENSNNLIEMKRLEVMPFIDMKIDKNIVEEDIVSPMRCIIFEKDGTFNFASSSFDITKVHKLYRGDKHWIYILKNIGNNSAHSINIKLNESIMDFGINLEKGEEKKYHLLISKDAKDMVLNFKIEFYDIYNNKYKQKFKYEEVYKEENIKSIRVGEVTAPEILDKKGG